MHADGVIVRGFRLALSLAALGGGVADAGSVATPLIAVQSNGDYVVSYAPCALCFADALEEYQSNGWEMIGSGTVSFSHQVPGTYRYRVVNVVVSALGSYHLAYGPEASVVVYDGESDETDAHRPLPTQFDADYSIASGDLDGDGLRDLLIRRSPVVSEAGNAILGDVMLRQTESGLLESSYPDQRELAIASSWTPTNVEIRKRDVNIDGYVDLVLRGLDQVGGFERVSNQILFAPGTLRSGLAPEIRVVDDSLARFSRDIDRHLVDPDYFPNNASLRYTVIVYYSLDCGWLGYSDWIEVQNLWPCVVEPRYLTIAYQDFSVFDQDAIAVAKSDYGMIHGLESTEIGMQTISSILSDMLGVGVGGWDINELLGEEAKVTDEAVRHGLELFSVLAGISEAVAQEVDDTIESAVGDRVLLKGRRVLGQGPFHTALEYRYSTVSAYDSDSRPLFDGTLVSEVNWPRDHPSLTLRLGDVAGPGGVASIYWNSLLAADGRYDDDLRYDLFPSLGEAGYNSNSFVSGLVRATLGMSTIEMATFVGGETPVPVSAFN